LCHDSLYILVIVNDLNLVRVPFAPQKADPAAIIDSNAMLSGTISLQHFQVVPADSSEVGETGGRIQSSPRYIDNFRPSNTALNHAARLLRHRLRRVNSGCRPAPP
jgi:hypothetical protein